MKRKILSMLIALIMLLPQVAMADAKRANIKDDEYKMSGELLTQLEVLEYSEANEEDIISRVDFAVYMARLLKVNEYELTNVTYYTDIDTEHYGAKSINYLTEIGAFSGYGNSEFMPNEPVSLNEAVKVIFSVLGYKTYAELNGGYPGGYYALAESADLLDGFSGCENLTRKELSVLMLRAGLIPVMEVKSISGGSVTFDSSESETLLERYWDIYEEEGIVTTEGYTSLNDKSEGNEGYITLNDNMYYFENSKSAEFLGRYVKALIKKPENGKEEVICAIKDDKKTEEIYIKSEDVVFYDDYVLKYYEGNKEKTAKIATDAEFIYNGTLAEYGVFDALNNIKKGEVYLIDVTKDDYADTVIIDSYETYVISRIDKDEEVIYDETSGKAVLKLEDYKHKKFYSAGGGEILMDSVAKGSVINVKESKGEYADIYVSNAVVSGKVTEVFYENDDLCVRVNDEVYKVDVNCALYNKSLFEGSFAGESYTFILDMFGEISYIAGYTKDTKKIGYIYDIKVVEDEYETVLIKVMNPEGKIVSYHTSEKTEVDGRRYSNPKDVKDNILLGDGRVIVYKENADGKIIYVDTTNKTEAETDKTLKLVTPLERASYEPQDVRYPGCRQWFKSGQSYSGVIMPSTSTVIFSVPEDANEKRENYYRIENWSTFADGRQMKCQSYKLDEESFHDDVVVEFSSSGTEVSKMADLFVINNISKVSDPEEGVSYKISGYSLGKQTSYMVEEGCMENNFSNEAGSKVYTDVSQLAPGSIIQPGVNALGRINAIRLLVDCNEDLDSLQTFADNNYHGLTSNSYNIARVFCNNVKKEGFELSYTKGGETAWKDILGTPSVTVVNTKLTRGDIVSVGSVDDIPTYKTVGEEIYPMFVYAYRYHLRDIVVYK